MCAKYSCLFVLCEHQHIFHERRSTVSSATPPSIRVEDTSGRGQERLHRNDAASKETGQEQVEGADHMSGRPGPTHVRINK